MARVTVEDCLKHIDNRFALVILAAERARQIAKGATPLVASENRPPVVALREIAAGKVRFRESVREELDRYLKEMAVRGARKQDNGA